MLSVRIPIKNNSQYLEQCLDSVARQTFKDFEILLGIEESVDTLHEAERIRHKYPNLRIFWTPECVGVGATFNALSYKAKGDWLVSFDSDDIMFPNLLENLYSNRNIASIVMIRCVEFSDNPSIKVPDRNIDGGTWIMSKGDFLKMGGYQSWNGAEDTEFTERAKKMGLKVHMIEMPGYKKRFHLNSVMNSKDEGLGSTLNNMYRTMIDGISGERIEPILSPCEEMVYQCEDV